MKTLDFASSDIKTAVKIVMNFGLTGEYRIFESMWKSRDVIRAMLKDRIDSCVNADGSVRIRTLTFWVQGKHLLLSIDVSRKTQLDILYGLVATMKAVKQIDYPVKVDKGDTITIKAAVAVAALAVAQGVSSGGLDGILMDMARDKVI